MITEDYVSFEIAKLLKEKGFKGSSIITEHDDAASAYIKELNEKHLPYSSDDPKLKEFYYTKPTLQMAMKWLRVEHKKFIDVYSYSDAYFDYIHGWSFLIRPLKYTEGIGWNIDDSYKAVTDFEASDDQVYPTYEEACEAAIKYCLENLI